MIEYQISGPLEQIVELLRCLENRDTCLFKLWWQTQISWSVSVKSRVGETVICEVLVNTLRVLRDFRRQFGDVALGYSHGGMVPYVVFWSGPKFNVVYSSRENWVRYVSGYCTAHGGDRWNVRDAVSQSPMIPLRAQSSLNLIVPP